VQKTLYVGNLSWGTTEEDLHTACSEHARVISCRIVTDRETRRPRGFGFVEVAAEDADKVVSALNGSILGGRELIVNEAKPRAYM
jgi:RNA recognition motif-containing protein